MKMVQVDLSAFPPKKQKDYREKLLIFAWDDYTIVDHPEILSLAWNQQEPIEEIFPELAPYLKYL